MNSVVKNDEIYRKNDGFCSKNDGFCSKNDGFCSKHDGFDRNNDELSSEKMLILSGNASILRQICSTLQVGVGILVSQMGSVYLNNLQQNTLTISGRIR